MGALSNALVEWVKAMNAHRAAGTDAGRAAALPAVTRAFNSMVAASITANATWDPADRLAWQILQAFDHAQRDD